MLISYAEIFSHRINTIANKLHTKPITANSC